MANGVGVAVLLLALVSSAVAMRSPVHGLHRLALEPTGADEHGSGFAAMACEIQKLAERSQRESRMIAEQARQLQSATADAVLALAPGAERAGGGRTQTEALVQTAEQFHALVGRFRLLAADGEEVEADVMLHRRGPARREAALPRAS